MTVLPILAAPLSSAVFPLCNFVCGLNCGRGISFFRKVHSSKLVVQYRMKDIHL